MELEFVVVSTDIINKIPRMVKVLHMNDEVPKSNLNYTLDQYKGICKKYLKQRDEGIELIQNFLFDEQQRFLSKGATPKEIFTVFEGMELSDTQSIKQKIAKIRSGVPSQMYDPAMCYDFFWTVSNVKKKSVCFVDARERLLKAIKTRDFSQIRAFLAKDYWRDFNYVIPDGYAVVIGG